MLNVKKILDMLEKKVFTDQGEYFGDVEECIMTMNKITGWRVKATRNSSLANLLTGAKGVIVPHQLVKSIGDVFIISKAAIPSFNEKEEEERLDEVQP